MVRYLREGLDNDDIYIMVEDEFYAVAQTFTQHLHYAEYVKKRDEAKQKDEATIQELARPTNGTPVSGETKKRKEAEALSARQKAGLDQLQHEELEVKPNEGMKPDDLEDAEEDADWAGTFLYDLMTSPRKARALVGTRGVKSSTRAAAGYSKQAGGSSQADRSSPLRAPPRVEEPDPEETASEDDDLDLQANLSDHRQLTRGNGADSFVIKSEANEIPSINARYRSPIKIKSRKGKLFDDFDVDELPEPSKPKMPTRKQNNPSLVRESQRKDSTGDEPKSKKSRLNEVPMFVL